MIKGTVTQDLWTTMNKTAPFAFIAPMAMSPDTSQLEQGIRAAIAGADRVEDIASPFATAYDQTVLTLTAGMLLSRPPLSVTRSPTSQVTRIPRAPFRTLIVLDFTYATIGTGLMVAALVAVRKGRGVRDAQARLSTLAVVAESFESPVRGDDAKSVDMLFAERRGEVTRRVALARRAGGGRKFKQVVISRSHVKKPLTSTAVQG